MTKTAAILAALLCAAAAQAAPGKKAAPFKPTGPYVEGEVVVQFKDGVESPSAREANAKVGGTVVKVLERMKLALVQLPAKTDTIKAVEQYRRQPGVLAAEPNYVRVPAKPASRAPAKKAKAPAAAPKKKR